MWLRPAGPKGAGVSADVASSEVTRAADRSGLILAVIVASQFMVVLDTAIVNVALPSIKADLHFSQENLQREITGYSICFGGVLLLGGRLADLPGRRRAGHSDVE
jgi:MFS family permease